MAESRAQRNLREDMHWKTRRDELLERFNALTAQTPMENAQ